MITTHLFNCIAAMQSPGQADRQPLPAWYLAKCHQLAGQAKDELQTIVARDAAMEKALRALISWAEEPAPACAAGAQENFAKDLTAAREAIEPQTSDVIVGKVSGVCLHCQKPVNTAQKNFHISIYGAIEVYTVNGPSALAAPLGSWCSTEHLIAWLREQLDLEPTQKEV